VSYLLDTCALSELPKAAPNPGVVDWFHATRESVLYVSALTLGELLKGIEKLPDGRRKQAIRQWFAEDVQDRFRRRVLTVDTEVCLAWARISAAAERNGHPRPAIDSLLAATAVVHDLTIVTRNLDDFAHLPIRTLSPWT
jgi:toxin FitB